MIFAGKIGFGLSWGLKLRMQSLVITVALGSAIMNLLGCAFILLTWLCFRRLLRVNLIMIFNWRTVVLIIYTTSVILGTVHCIDNQGWNILIMITSPSFTALCFLEVAIVLEFQSTMVPMHHRSAISKQQARAHAILAVSGMLLLSAQIIILYLILYRPSLVGLSAGSTAMRALVTNFQSGLYLVVLAVEIVNIFRLRTFFRDHPQMRTSLTKMFTKLFVVFSIVWGPRILFGRLDESYFELNSLGCVDDWSDHIGTGEAIGLCILAVLNAGSGFLDALVWSQFPPVKERVLKPFLWAAIFARDSAREVRTSFARAVDSSRQRSSAGGSASTTNDGRESSAKYRSLADSTTGSPILILGAQLLQRKSEDGTIELEGDGDSHDDLTPQLLPNEDLTSV